MAGLRELAARLLAFFSPTLGAGFSRLEITTGELLPDQEITLAEISRDLSVLEALKLLGRRNARRAGRPCSPSGDHHHSTNARLPQAESSELMTPPSADQQQPPATAFSRL